MLRPRLSDDQVRQIRSLYRKPGISQVQIAKQFGVSATMVGHIVRGTNYAHVTDQPQPAPRTEFRTPAASTTKVETARAFLHDRVIELENEIATLKTVLGLV